ncbi:TATA-binding protein-associated factor 2N isoform X1 [Maniola jurtina]|uniref:TATA-binding protein-associated factor 2N isoform X1 n=1 Tax=Maniola jurtina TaxID=191418 RepID=UPI001E68F9FA|nr:TATA-binding protein-associated factor 2N isoform X1 [Maniola jurtina]
MDRFTILICILTCIIHCQGEGETVLSAVLTPDEKPVLRQERSYYDQYGYDRPYARLDDRPSRCGRCDDDEDDDDDDYDRGRGRDDDRRTNRPTYGSRNDRNDRTDRNKYDDDDNRRYDDRSDRNNRNGTDDHDDKKHDDDKDSDRPHRRRNKNRHRYDDRNRYRPDYYDQFLRDPYRDRYDDPYRRPAYDRYYPDRYDDYGRDAYYPYSGYRRPLYEDRYDRGSGYSDGYGGYGPGVGRAPHDSFRPWDETYRGQAGWDSGGRGYYFASGRPDSTSWGQQQYARPATSGGGWQNTGYSTGYGGGYRDPGYQGSVYAGTAGGYAGAASGYAGSAGGYSGSTGGYSGAAGGYSGAAGGYSGAAGGYSGAAGGYSGAAGGYAGGYQDQNSGGYGQSSGWRNVGERRPYRDQSGVAHLDTKVTQEQDTRYGQNRPSYQSNTYPSQSGAYGQTSSSSSTPGTSYLFQREDEVVSQSETTVAPS